MWSDPIRTDLFASIGETYKWPELTQHKGNTEPLRLGEGFDTSYNQENKNWGYLRSGGFPNKDGYTFNPNVKIRFQNSAGKDNITQVSTFEITSPL